MEIKHLKTITISVLLLIRTFVSCTDSESNANTLFYNNEKDGIGNYEYRFETSNGISRQESGSLKNAGQPNAHLLVVGSYRYTAPNGEVIEATYEADENGFRILPLTTPSPVVFAQVSPEVVASLLG